MGEQLSDPSDYYEANQALLLETTKAIDRLISQPGSTLITQDTLGKLAIEQGGYSGSGVRADYLMGGTEPSEAPEEFADELAAQLNEALIGSARTDIRQARQWLTSLFVETTDEADLDQLLAEAVTELVEPDLRAWQRTERELADGTVMSLSRTTFYGADTYGQACTYRATDQNHDTGQDTFIVVIDDQAVHALTRHPSEAGLQYIPATNRPDAEQLHRLRDQLSELE